MLQGEASHPTELSGIALKHCMSCFNSSGAFQSTISIGTTLKQSFRCLPEAIKLLQYILHVYHKPGNLVHITLQCRQCLPKFVDSSLTSRDQETVHGCFLSEL